MRKSRLMGDLSSELKLSVVDQSPVRKGGTARDALTETVELARAVERLGYRRFWVAEHHNLANFAGTSPEILIGQIAANTQSIRVGSGGVMLPHYSAFKVAEVFRMLETLFPGRIDLGIGRAPGSDQITAAALSYPRPQLDVRHYPVVVRDLLNFLHDTVDGEHPFASLHAGPGEFTTPDVWLLGSRADSAAMAAEMGLPFSFAHFFGLATEHGPAIAEMYRQNFQPSEYLSEPKVNVALQVLCAETDEDAQRIGASRNLSRVRSVQNIREGVPPIEEALAYEYRPDEWAYLSKLKESYIDGTPEYVRDKIEALAYAYDTNDIGVVTICYDFADRVRSYELVAEAFGLDRQER
ncbi:MAG: LLM class flavin-dependent oxidoreductase [Chloroflexota bacterium]|nr:LLM class flavin-dependent oxidoreductase [Chloroflexota bacterium]